MRENEAQVHVNNALASQEKFYCDKSRVNWLSDGDRNTSFFHAMVKIRTLKQSLSVLRDGNRIIEDPNEISSHILSYFQGMFKADPNVVDTGLVDRIIPRLVSDDENTTLIAMPSSDEIFLVMSSMDRSSAPGPDGFGGYFYHHCWSIVGPDVTKAVQSFFSDGFVLPNFNSNLLVLIPKVSGADSVSQLRPIALANFVFKIITRIMADRLSPIASRIISPQQSAFIRGRSIIDPIITTSECINLLDRECKFGNIAIKFDICKAFDTLDWRFLLNVMTAFGFSPLFVDWISAILASATLSLLINGSVEGFFNCSRGVRQGDPLSPILFCLAEEVFSRGVSSLVENGLIDPISTPLGVVPPSHVLFADDIMVFMRSSKRSMRNLMHFVEEYGMNSGQRISKAKSLVFFGKSARSRSSVIRKILGVRVGSLPFTYLGVPIFPGRPKRIYFQNIADKVRCKLSTWKGSLLTQAGRLQLINSVIHGLLIYSFQIYAWPVNLLRELQGWVRNFFWTGNPLKRGIPLIPWSACCKPKEEGGLGTRDLFEMNNSLLIKRCWEVISSSSPSAILLSSRFLKENFQVVKAYKKSSVWLGLKKVWNSFFSTLQWNVGNGRKISFWHDNWLGAPLVSKIGLHPAISSEAKVQDVISQSQWVFPSNFATVFPQIVHNIQKIDLPIEPMEDFICWNGSVSGNLTAKEAFTFFSEHADRKEWGTMIWNNAIPPSRSIVIWKALHGRLLTDAALQRRGISLASRCPFCCLTVETMDHILLSCPKIVPIWKWVLILFSKPFSPWTSLEEVFLGTLSLSLPTSLRTLWVLISGTIVW